MREKIAEVLKHRGVDTLFNEHVAGVYGKEDAPDCENYINTTTDQIIKELSEEIEKGLLTYEEMDKAYCLADLHQDTLGHEAIAQAQLEKILAQLK